MLNCYRWVRLSEGYNYSLYYFCNFLYICSYFEIESFQEILFSSSCLQGPVLSVGNIKENTMLDARTQKKIRQLKNNICRMLQSMNTAYPLTIFNFSQHYYVVSSMGILNIMYYIYSRY